MSIPSGLYTLHALRLAFLLLLVAGVVGLWIVHAEKKP